MSETDPTPDLRGLSSLLQLGIQPDPAVTLSHAHPALEAAAAQGYRILTSVARGGFGQIWRAIHPKTQRDVAIKFVNKESTCSLDVLVEMLAEEGAILSELNDAHFPRVLEAGGSGESYFIAMDYIDGDPVSQYCDTTRLTLEARLSLIEKIFEAVGMLHEKGIAHGDIKPSNVLMGDKTTPVLVDFGMAVRFRRDHSRLVQPLHVGGTPAYMAPELLSKRATALRPEADVFSLCVLALELIDSDTTAASVSSQVRRALGRGLAADPLKRTPDATALLDDLKRARQYVAPHHRRPVQVAAASLVTLLGATAWVAVSWPEADTPPNYASINAAPPQARSIPLHHETVSLLRTGSTDSARQQLDALPREQRGWEWDYLMDWTRTDHPPIFDLALGEPNTYDASWSTDSNTLAYSTSKQEVYVLSAASDKRRLATNLPLSPQFVAVDNDAEHVLISTSEGVLFHCRQLGSETTTHAIPLEHPVRKVHLCDADEALTAWTLTKEPIQVQQLKWNAQYENWSVVNTHPCFDAIFGIDPAFPVLIFSGESNSMSASVLSITGDVEVQIDLPAEVRPMSYAYSPEVQTLYVGDYQGSIWRYQTDSGWEKFLQIPTEQAALSMDLAPESDRLFVAATDAYVVDTKSGRILLRLNDEDRRNIILKIRWDEESQTLHALTSDRARIWGHTRRVVLH